MQAPHQHSFAVQASQQSRRVTLQAQASHRQRPQHPCILYKAIAAVPTALRTTAPQGLQLLLGVGHAHMPAAPSVHPHRCCPSCLLEVALLPLPHAREGRC